MLLGQSNTLSACVWVFRLCLTLRDPKDYGPPGSAVHGILQARIQECVAVSSSRGSSFLFLGQEGSFILSKVIYWAPIICQVLSIIMKFLLAVFLEPAEYNTGLLSAWLGWRNTPPQHWADGTFFTLSVEAMMEASGCGRIVEAIQFVQVVEWGWGVFFCFPFWLPLSSV